MGRRKRHAEQGRTDTLASDTTGQICHATGRRIQQPLAGGASDGRRIRAADRSGRSKRRAGARPRSKASWKTATLITATFIGLYFYVTRDAGQQEVVRISTTGGQVVE